MKYIKSLVYTTIILYISMLSSCSTIGVIGVLDEMDDNLPVIQTFRALPDVTSIGFEWTTPERIDKISGYVIYRKNKEGQFVKIAHIKDPLSTHYYDGKLSPQTQYEYTIASVGLDSKVSRQSEILSTKTSFIDPVDFVYASHNYANRIKVFWSPSPNPVVGKYLVQRLDNDNFVTIGYTNNRMSVEFFDDNLDSGQSYKYRVIAQNYDGANSIPSKVISGSTRQIPTPVQHIKTTKDKQEAIWVEWQRHASEDIIGYNVYSSSTREGNYKRLAFVNGTTFVDKIQGNGVRRFYKVTAMDKYKLESSLDSYAIEGITLPPPQSPNIIGIASKDRIKISWDKVHDPRITSYIVYRKDNKSKTPVRFSNINDSMFIDPDAMQGVYYSYYATSVDSLGIESLPSNTITILLEPREPTNIHSEDSTDKNDLQGIKSNSNPNNDDSRHIESNETIHGTDPNNPISDNNN